MQVARRRHPHTVRLVQVGLVCQAPVSGISCRAGSRVSVDFPLASARIVRDFPYPVPVPFGDVYLLAVAGLVVVADS